MNYPTDHFHLFFTIVSRGRFILPISILLILPSLSHANSQTHSHSFYDTKFIDSNLINIQEFHEVFKHALEFIQQHTVPWVIEIVVPEEEQSPQFTQLWKELKCICKDEQYKSEYCKYLYYSLSSYFSNREFVPTTTPASPQSQGRLAEPLSLSLLIPFALSGFRFFLPM